MSFIGSVSQPNWDLARVSGRQFRIRDVGDRSHSRCDSKEEAGAHGMVASEHMAAFGYQREAAPP